MNAPDMSQAYELLDRIYELTKKYGELQLKINAAKSAIVNKVVNDPKYWKNGKPPSMSFIEKTYLISGIDGFDMLALLKEKEEVKSELDYMKMKLEIFKLEVEVWRTESANQRTLS